MLFCDDCEIVFCDKCVILHCEHLYRPVPEKACDVRKSIFELLTRFEDLAKTVKRRECMEQETFDERDKVVKSLERGNFESTLITVATKVIHDNVDLLYDMKPKTENSAKRSDFVCSLSKSNDKQIIELRELLKSSDGACIEQFPDKAKLMEASLDEQREHLNSHVYLQWQRNWENVLLHSIREESMA